jgi:hypothetical protein
MAQRALERAEVPRIPRVFLDARAIPDLSLRSISRITPRHPARDEVALQQLDVERELIVELGGAALAVRLRGGATHQGGEQLRRRRHS